MTIQKKVFDFILFTSFYIAACSVLMLYQTYTLFIQKPIDFHYLAFVFFSTVSSYNLHWMLTPHSVNPSFRVNWSIRHKGYHLILFVTGLLLSIYFFTFFIHYWFWIGISAGLTFLYTAPKIPVSPFPLLKKLAFGKTFFLAFVWTYVTVILPMFIENTSWSEKSILFCLEQFFFIFSISILFDYRDRADDIADGIRSMIVYLNEKSINILFAISILLSASLLVLLLREGLSLTNFLFLLTPLLILSILYRHAKKNFSDYLYCFVLDGLLMLSGLMLWIMSWF